MSEARLTNTITKEQALEKYGKVVCKFSSYYKFTFTFTGTAPDGAKVSISIGGNHDDIYRYEVTAASFETLKADNYYSASVFRGEQELWNEYRY